MPEVPACPILGTLQNKVSFSSVQEIWRGHDNSSGRTLASEETPLILHIDADHHLFFSK